MRREGGGGGKGCEVRRGEGSTSSINGSSNDIPPQAPLKELDFFVTFSFTKDNSPPYIKMPETKREKVSYPLCLTAMGDSAVCPLLDTGLLLAI